MIKMLTVDQIPAASEFGPAFFAEGGFPGRFIPEVFCSKWKALVDGGIGFIVGLFSGDKMTGVFGAVVVEDLNDGELVANECFWFVSPESRGRGFELLLAYEEEARRRGAKRCSMIHLLSLQPEKLAEIYKKRGYRAIETSYLKELN